MRTIWPSGHSIHGMRKSLEDIRTEIAQVNAEAEWLCDELTDEQLAWRPAPNCWSIAENLSHLNLTTQVFLPVVDRAMEEGRRDNLLGEGPFELGIGGRIFVWYVEPPPKLRLPAPKLIRPVLQGPAVEALPQFLRSQELLFQRVDLAEGLDCSRIKFRSPLSAMVKMNLISFFAVGTGHQRRHLAQAAGVKTRISGRIEGGRTNRPGLRNGTYAE